MSRLHDAQCEVSVGTFICNCISRRQAADADRCRDAEMRDRLDAIDDATTERVLDAVLREAPDLYRALTREASQIAPDAVTDALRAEGAMP